MVSEDQSAVSHMLYLEKGFSAKGGEKIHAIMEFPKIVEKNSFPNFIKSCFQKLSVCFLEGNNTDRMYIVNAIEQIQNDITLISGFGSIVDNFHQVIYKNDPLSRIAALGAFNALAPCLQLKNVDEKIGDESVQSAWNDILTPHSMNNNTTSVISKNKSSLLKSTDIFSTDEDLVAYFKIMNTIIDCLSSTNEEEIHAAIKVASTFSKMNPQFSKILVPKVNEILLTTNNNDIVDKLINLYTAMSHHMDSAHMAYECCYQLFCSYPFRSLNVMTSICCNCSSLVHSYLEFLLDMISSDELVNDILLLIHATLQLSIIAKKFPSLFQRASFLNHLWDLLFVNEKIKTIITHPKGFLPIGYGLVMWIHFVRNDVHAASKIFNEKVDNLILLLSTQDTLICFLLGYIRLTIFLKDGSNFDRPCLEGFKNLLRSCIEFSKNANYNVYFQLGIKLCEELYLKINPKLQFILIDFVFNLCFIVHCPLKYILALMKKVIENSQLPLKTLKHCFKQASTITTHSDRLDVYKLFLLQTNNVEYSYNSSLEHVMYLCFSPEDAYESKYLEIPVAEEACLDINDDKIDFSNCILNHEQNITILTLLGLDCLFRGDVFSSFNIFHKLTERNDVSKSINQCLTFFFRLAKCESMIMLTNNKIQKSTQIEKIPTIDIISLVAQDFINIITSNVMLSRIYKNQREFQELYLLIRIDILNLASHWLKYCHRFKCESSLINVKSIKKQLLLRINNIIEKWTQLIHLTIDVDCRSEQFLHAIGEILEMMRKLLTDFCNNFNNETSTINNNRTGSFYKSIFNSINSNELSPFIQRFASTVSSITQSTNTYDIIESIVREVLLVGWPIPKCFFHVDNHTWCLLCVSHGSSLNNDTPIVVKKNVYLVFLVEGIIKHLKDDTHSHSNSVERAFITLKATPVPKNNSAATTQQQPIILAHSVSAIVQKNYFHTEIQIAFQTSGLFSVYAEIDSVIDASDRSWCIPYSCTKVTVQI